jgi:hypothetical protein
VTVAGAAQHWFDRLAAPHTRAHALRVALGAAALTLPLARASAAGAARADDCTWGCAWAARKRADAATSACVFTGFRHVLDALALGGVLAPVAFRAAVACNDRAVLQERADLWNCGQPGCPGFDPKAPGNPCDGCTDNCCPCAAATSGYICCVFPCDDPQHNCCP